MGHTGPLPERVLIEFTIPIAAMPVQTGGKRLVIVGGKPRFFKSKKVSKYEDALMFLADRFRPTSPAEGPVEIAIMFAMPRPKRLMRKNDPEGLVQAITRPDWDNLPKAVMDVLTRLGFWRDDAQITDVTVKKRFAEKNGAPRIEISIAFAKERLS